MVATAAPRLTVPYAGIGTRGIALAIDAAIANGLYIVGAALLGLIGSLVGDLRPQWLVAVIAAIGWALVVGGYFVLFWVTTGQTPGMRMMRVRVVSYRGERVHLVRALIRLGGLFLAIIPLFAGFLPVLVDERRRATRRVGAVVHVVADRGPYGERVGVVGFDLAEVGVEGRVEREVGTEADLHVCADASVQIHGIFERVVPVAVAGRHSRAAAPDG